ncbi:ankyrin repeat domain-containing protein 17-like [Physella acuta]|uniref:ankyrin repeat domain-containing protein 17-like n=1 Tax=Physella acuta TaxID=109671 RepID=UPI0027DDF250|nr:ankyrin repeat domain-containing protein 17-like [Physella acuta]
MVAAAEAGDISTLRKLIRKKIPISVTDDYAGHSEVVKILLDAGVDMDQTVGSNVSSLHLAATNNRTSTVKYLVAEGAQLKTRNDNSLIPKDMCMYNSETWKVLKAAEKGEMPDLVVESDVPEITDFSIPKVEKTSDSKTKKKGKKGKSGKGKKKKRRKEKKEREEKEVMSYLFA